MFKGENLKEIRIKSGKSQEELSKLCQIAPSTLAHYERNRRVPKKDMVLKFCEIFNVQENYFYGGEPDRVRELIDELVKKKIINNADDIKDDIANLILETVRSEIRLKALKLKAED